MTMGLDERLGGLAGIFLELLKTFGGRVGWWTKRQYSLPLISLRWGLEASSSTTWTRTYLRPFHELAWVLGDLDALI